MGNIKNKDVFLKTLLQYGIYVAKREEQWKAISIALYLNRKWDIPVEVRKAVLRYLYRVKSGWERKVRRRFGKYPNEQSMWGFRLIVREGIPINLL